MNFASIKQHKGLSITLLNSALSVLKIFPFMYILQVEDFANLSISLAVSGVLFIISPRIMDALDYMYINNLKTNNKREISMYSSAILVQIGLIIIGSMCVYLILVIGYKIDFIEMWLAGIGMYIGQTSFAIASPYFKVNGKFHTLQFISLVITFIGLLASIPMLLIYNLVQESIMINFLITPVLIMITTAIYLNKKIGFSFTNIVKNTKNLIFKNKEILFHGLSNSVIKSMNEYGMLLILASYSTKIDVVIFSVARSLLMPFRVYQTYIQALIYKQFSIERGFEHFSKIKESSIRSALIVFLFSVLMSILAYAIEVYYGYGKYPDMFLILLILGSAASVTISAIWTYPLAVKYKMLSDRSKSAIGRLIVSIAVIALLPTALGAALAILSATTFSRLTFDRKLVKRIYVS
jgi:hypothetical protein